MARRNNQKLSFKYFGPYEVLARIGRMAYKLKLPAGSQIHPVLHVSQLKKQVPPDQVISRTPSCNILTDSCFDVQPLAITGTRSIKNGHGFRDQVRVQWTHLPQEVSTWESEAALKHRFPSAPAWGQAALQGEGTATTPGTRRCRCRDIRQALGRLKAKPAQADKHATTPIAT